MPVRGLTSEEALRRLRDDGPNALQSQARKGLLQTALGVLRDPMFMLLVAAAAVYLVLGDVREALVLAASIVVILAITIVQEHRTERALEALRDLSSPRALVIRDGAENRIAGSEVVRGDVLIASEGDRIAADARLLHAHELQLDESLLTGESVPVKKHTDDLVDSGTLVVSGRAVALVAATGSNTELGRIGGMLEAIATEKTTLERETARVVKVLGSVAVLLCIALAAIYVSASGELLSGALAGLTLAMAIIPEEFPVVLTVFLALGAWRIARSGVLTRRMPSIEMLGAATVLCVDKTGTLTEGRMAVAEVYSGQSWSAPARREGSGGADVLETAALACEVDPFDPMDQAILAAARQHAPAAITVRASWRLEKDYGLDPNRRAMCHAWRDADGVVHAAMKGAPEGVLELCNLSEEARELAAGKSRAAAKRGLRILAIARARFVGAAVPQDPAEFAFEWLGFVGLADPLRASVPAAVDQCRRAGVRVVMITGDYPETALAIARAAGLPSDAGAVTGRELAAMHEAELAVVVRRVSVFARILPEQKLRLVSAYKAAGDVVAMTGDGVNDAPALRAAHIGIAMGKRGTDVAREAAALVLTNDDFGAIVATVRLGRRIYENIRNAMRYLFAVHVPIAGMSFLPLIFGWPLFLFPVHVVFLEFVIDPACSVVFEAEPNEESSMARPPRDPREPLFSGAMMLGALSTGAVVLFALALAYAWAVHGGYTEEEVRATGFSGIVFANLFLIYAMRSSARGGAATSGVLNRPLVWVVVSTLVALAAVLYVAPIAEIFRLAPLGFQPLLVAVGVGAAALATAEAFKFVRVRRR